MTTAAPTARAVVNAFFDRFGSGDLPGALDLFAERVDFEVGGAANVPWAGSRSTRSEIADFFAVLTKELTPAEEFTLHTTVADDRHAVVLGRSRFGVRVTGRTFTNDFALHITVADGRIVGYHMYEDTHAISTAFPPAA
ncbi:nuclear transport factor 2 family protein [Streptomyces sp. 351MFTsu5.1]|uniref:nuclear transport factor 2 family protein n=1 Tax=Streptomyces sp. 351MFTsu5.1 TaxID=1172180 RepID=UPI000361B104|nr:nuclear transport factor 2 family protein [Streptomyces sp. 351MFTsu5.1]